MHYWSVNTPPNENKSSLKLMENEAQDKNWSEMKLKR